MYSAANVSYLSEMVGYIQLNGMYKTIDDIIQESRGELKSECMGVGHVIRNGHSRRPAHHGPPANPRPGTAAPSGQRSRNRRTRRSQNHANRNQPPTQMMASLSIRI